MPSAYRLCCLLECPNPACRKPIVLPRRSPSEMFPDQPNPSTGKRSTTFLCIECGLPFECPTEAVRPHHIDTRNLDQQLTLLWRIEFVCAIENCGKQKPIFFAYASDAEEIAVRKKLFSLRVWVSCAQGHHQELISQQVEVWPVLQ